MQQKLTMALLLLAGMTACTGISHAQVDQYGGFTSVACPNGPRPHFYTEKIGDRWWLCDPAGHSFFMKGLVGVLQSVDVQQENIEVPPAGCWGAGQPAPCCTGVGTGPTCGSKYYTGVNNPYVISSAQDPSDVWMFNWVIEQMNRLKSWSFNTVADDSHGFTWPTTTDSRWNTADHTIPSQFRSPFDLIKNTTNYAFTNRAGSGCNVASPIKDMLNGLTAGERSAVYYDYGDYFDPNYVTCINGQANPANDAVLRSATQGPHNDYLLYITLDEGNQTGFSDQGPDFPTIGDNGVPNNPVNASAHPGWVVLTTAPTQTSNSYWGVTSYPDHEVYSKVRFADMVATEYAAVDCTGAGTPFAACTGNGTAANGSIDPSCSGTPLLSYCMGDTYIGATEMAKAVGRLDAAWAANYTTVSSTDPNCSTSLAACLQQGTYASWGIGTGLLDENGSCPSAGGSSCWIGEPCTLQTSSTPGACEKSNITVSETAAMRVDMSTYLSSYADRYYGAITNAFHTYEPGILLQMIVGGWGAPPRAEVLKEASKYLDLPQLTVPPYCPTCTDVQKRIDFVARYMGDEPWMMWEGFYANPDSAESQHVLTDNIATTQAGRGVAYQRMVTNMLAAKDSVYNSYHVVGFYWWDEFDMNAEGRNWGLVSVNDNGYDGCSATVIGCGLDQWGYSTGGEVGNYGNFLSDVTSANNGVLANMPP